MHQKHQEGGKHVALGDYFNFRFRGILHEVKMDLWKHKL